MSEPRRATPSLCPIVALHSARGGVGTSLAALNVAGLLAARGLRVLLVDLDLEAPGISRLVDGLAARAGALERLLAADADATVADAMRCALPAALAAREGGSLRALGAGRLDASYDARLAELAAGRGEAQVGAQVSSMIRGFAEDPAGVDVVIIDGGRGRVAARRLAGVADLAIVFSGLGPQHVAETAALLGRLAGEGTPAIEVILSPIPDGEDDLVEARKGAAREAFAAACGEELGLGLEIPYHPQLALDGRLHALRGRGRPFAAYQRIARRVLARTGDTVEVRVAAALAALEDERHDESLAQLRRARLVDDGAAWIDGFARGFADLCAPPDGPGRPLFELIVGHAGGAARRQVGRALLRVGMGQWGQGRLDAAELRFVGAVEVSPDDANILGSYANFLCDERRELDAAEVMYRRAVAADDENRDNLCNFAIFLADERRALDEAEVLYRQALEVDPEHAFTLCSYGTFLADERADAAAAEAMYRRAIAADTADAGNHANLARLLLASGRVAQGRDALGRALALLDGDAPGEVDAECWMYAFCCDVEARRGEALERLRALVDAGIDTGTWDFRGVVAEAARMGHPEAEWLRPLAEVLGGRSPASTLEGWDAWRAAKRGAPADDGAP